MIWRVILSQINILRRRPGVPVSEASQLQYITANEQDAERRLWGCFTFTFSHLADTFIQSDLHNQAAFTKETVV